MGITYKVYYANKEDSTTSTAIHTTYQMVIGGKDFDLCEVMREELMENIQKIKTSRYHFLFGILLICLIFYFMNELPNFKGKV